jgi:phosphate starvation-inducible PhoH-like protein
LIEKIIVIDNVNPATFFSSDNATIPYLKKKFPTLNISSRGDEIKALGSSGDLELFEKKVNEIMSILLKNPAFSFEEAHDLLDLSFEVAPSMKEADMDVLVFGPKGKVIKARTPNQKKLVQVVSKNDIVFALGPAGTGKTYTAVAIAVKALKDKEIKKIILARPAVEAGESLGFLPGDMKDKIDPYLRPLYDSLQDMIPPEKYSKYIEDGTIEIAPMAFMRGRTLDNCFVILDEAQNATDVQLKMFLTRMGPHAKIIVTGDLSQIDLPKAQRSGLKRAVGLLKDVRGIEIVELTIMDVVRHRLVKDIINAYDNDSRLHERD